MTTVAEDLVTYLETDATLLALLTGGIYSSEEVGRQGFTYTDQSGNLFSDSTIKPTAYVRARSQVPTSALRDQGQGAFSFRQVVEIWLLQDNAYGIIESAKVRIITLLHDQHVNSRHWQLFNTREGRRSNEVAGAMEIVLDFWSTGIQGDS